MRKSSTQCMQKKSRQTDYSSHYEKFNITTVINMDFNGE